MGHQFRLKFLDDQLLSYSLSSKNTQKTTQQGEIVGEERGGFEAALDQKVIRTLPDGSAHLVAVTVPQPGPGIPPGTRSVVYQHLGPQGQVYEISGSNQGNAFAFPDEAVESGSSWEGLNQHQLPNLPQAISMRYIYTYERDENLQGILCARISFTSEPVEFEMPVPNGQGVSQVTTASDGTMWFAPEQGFLVKLLITTRTRPHFGQMVLDIESNITQELLV